MKGPKSTLLQLFWMKALNQQQIKQQELILLQTSGFSLAEYAKGNTSNFYKDLPNFNKIPDLERLKTNRVKSLGLSSNANLKGFALALLISIYSNPVKQDLLSIVKSCLYHPEMDLNLLKHSQLPSLSNQQMKKLMVEFFFTLAYSDYDDKIQDKLRKYSVIMEILVIFLRCLLFKYNINNAQDCLFKLPTSQIYQLLINMFDINCKFVNSIYLFYDDHIFLYENQNNQILIGNYVQNQMPRNNINQLKKTLKLSELEEEIEYDTQNDKSQKQSQSHHNRSLELRGVVSQSIVFEPQAPTPFFNLDADNNSSFQSSQDQDMGEDDFQRKRKSLKVSKDMSLLKMMDRSMHSYQNPGGLGNMVRSKMIQNQLKQSLQYKQTNLGAIMDSPISPITLDSPHTLFSDGNFGSIGQQMQRKESIKVMKKSKSENASRMSQDLELNHEEKQAPAKDMKKKERIFYGKSKKQKNPCECIKSKKKEIKLCSNLYQINMRYVVSQHAAQQKRGYNPNLDFSQGQIYISSKGLNWETEVTQNRHNSSLQYLKSNDTRQRLHNNLDTSINSCYILPKVFKDSQTQSKRQFSPLSNNERSRSPIETKSIASPKVTFSYKNPLMHSTQISKHKMRK